MQHCVFLCAADQWARWLPLHRAHSPSLSLSLYFSVCSCSPSAVGKRAAEFSSPAASSYPSSQCFSIVSRDRSLHLVAPSEPIRAVWLQGVKEVFAKQKEAAAAKKKGSASATAPLQPQTQTQQESAQTAPAAVTETAAPVAVATAPVASTTTAAAAAAAPVAPPNVLAEGRRYRSVVLDASAPGGATATEIFLWHDPTEGKLGTLHWCVPSSSEGSVTKTKSAGKSMAVKTIRDVMLYVQRRQRAATAAVAGHSLQRCRPGARTVMDGGSWVAVCFLCDLLAIARRPGASRQPSCAASSRATFPAAAPSR